MMEDSSTKFFNIKTIPPTREGEPPVVAVPNVKTIVISFLKDKLNSLKLKNKIEVFSDQPYYVNMFQRAQESGRVDLPIKRWIDVILLSSSVKLRSVGEIVKTREIEELVGKEIVHYGWVEATELQVTYASISSTDRDKVGHLIKLFMLEAHRSGYLLKNGIYSMQFRTEYDSFDQRVELNQPVYYRVMHFIFESFFFAVSSIEEDLGVLIEEIDIDPSIIDDGTDSLLGSLPSDDYPEKTYTTLESGSMTAPLSFELEVPALIGGDVESEEGC